MDEELVEELYKEKDETRNGESNQLDVSDAADEPVGLDDAMGIDEKVDLLCAHYDFVSIVTRKIGIDRDSVEDVAQNAMTSAYIGIDGLREPEKIKSWLRSIVKNEAKSYYAEESKQRQILEALQEEAAATTLISFSEYVAGEIAFREMMRREDDKEFAWEIMDRLSSVHRSIMYMRYWGGYPFKEIGEILNIKPSTARCMYTRCRQRLCIRYANKDREEAGPVDIRKKYAYLYDDE